MEIPEIERKAVLALFPYLSKESVVVDVGSNKGEWAEILVDNVGKMVLFEPNEILLSYTKVKFCHLNNVEYYQCALSDKMEKADFYYFTNENNGLSSLYNNPRWDNLPKKVMIVNKVILDSCITENIDLLKIDVEGADLDVLKGAEALLKEKKIRFIQVEKSDHLALAGYTVNDMLDFMASVGYYPYHFNGSVFEEYRNQEAENIYFMAEKFTQNWNSEFIKNTEFLKGKVHFALEVGCFEGLTTNYICDFLLDKSDPSARLIAVDPLWEQYLPPDKMKALGYDPDDPVQVASWPDFKGQYERFTRNTRGRPVELVRAESRPTWKTEKFYHYRFDFIYLDGDHTEMEVFNDGMEAFRCCLKQGYILFDDYGWRPETAAGIDRCLRKLDGLYERVNLDSTYQIMIKKTKNIQ